MNFDLKKHTILLTVAGSRAYGMSKPDSDTDVKGICLPPSEFRDGFLYNFEQADKKDAISVFNGLLFDYEVKNGVEGSVYEIRKFFSLAADNNPNILDALFCRNEEIRFITPSGAKLRDCAQEFLSSKCRWTFGGYAKSQLNRLRSHRSWLLSPINKKPTRLEFGLPERTLIPTNQLEAAQAAIKKKIDSWEVDYGTLDEAGKIYIQDQLAKNWAEMKLGTEEKYTSAARAVGYDENFILLLDKERRYKAAITNYNQYLTWKSERNKERAEMEAKFGFDGKHASHLIRLLRMCREILETSKVNVFRHDAEELLAIRNGAWNYDQLMEEVEREEGLIEAAYINTKLPKAPDKVKLNNLCCELVAKGIY